MVSSPTPHQLTVESSTCYAIGVVMVALRMLSRRLTLGSLKRMQLEDYLMLFNSVVYTILLVAINVSGRTATNLLAPGELETLTPDDIETRIYGSKVVIVLEQAMLVCVWTTKACMLMLYNRLCQRLPHQTAIKIIAVYTAVGFVAIETTWLLNCRPLSGYWALPVPDQQCATYQRYVIVQAVFNLSSDLMMLAVGIPLILRARVELKKKAVLAGIFSLGFFVVLAAALSKYYNLSYPWTTVFMVWYVREASAAIYVANIPLLWPLFRRFARAGSFGGAGTGGSTTPGGSRVNAQIKGSSSAHSEIALGRIAVGYSPQPGNPFHRDSNAAVDAAGEHERSNSRNCLVEVEVETRVSVTLERKGDDEDNERVGGATFDVESYGDAKYTATICASASR